MRAVESKAGVIAFLAGIWLVVAPVVLHFDAADIRFRPYWPAMAVAVVLMLVGLIRAVAPLDVPWLGAITFLLGLWLALAPLIAKSAQASGLALANQTVVGTGVVLSCVVTALLRRRV